MKPQTTSHKMKTIWMINQYAVSPDIPGGTRHNDLSSELAKKKFEVYIFASDFSLLSRKFLKLRPGKLYQIEEVEGVKFVWTHCTPYKYNNWRRVLNMLSFSLNVFRIGRRMKSPDIIIGSSPHLFGALSAYCLSKIKRSKFLLELRDLWPQVLVDMKTAKESDIKIKFLRVIESLLCRKSSMIIILASGMKDYLYRRGVQPEKFIFIPNGVHPQHFISRLGREEARKKYRFDKFVAVYLGAHGPANALHTILEAAEILKPNSDLYFTLVGDGPCKPDLVKLAMEKNLENVRFCDPVPKTEVPDLLLAADIGIITLRDIKVFSYGISPNKLFDYMGAELPVICAISGDMSKLVEEANAGMALPPEQPKVLAEAVIRLFNDPALRRVMGSNGKQFVLEHNNWEKLTERLTETM